MRPFIPPPIILIFYIGIALGLDTFSPLDVLLGEARWPLALLLTGIGILIAGLGVFEFRRHQTTVHPLKPEKASTLVTTGVFSFTRNPMYLGMLMVLIGAVSASQDVLSLLAPAGFIVTLNRLQIRPEERAMKTLFGEVYDAYCHRVRRWI